jgi:hypothetical protein
MNSALAKEYGTISTEDLEKQAEVELFVKLAAENGIDLGQLSDEQIESLYASTFSKAAEDEGKDEKKEEKKDDKLPPFMKKDEKEEAEKAAAAELASAQEWQAEQEKADYLGRKMAHAMTDELRKIAAVQNGAPVATAPVVGAEKQASAGTKQLSPLDKLAAEHAVKLAAENGFDAEEAGQRVGAVSLLGLAPVDSKVASAKGLDLEGATHVRALEYLEAAGYPVTWDKA